ncbi:hypothetical protein BLNAU_17748 [Blattamonas nauphoetae]|uniref:Uncharacterized protein n=1 Tax=Blattamonas nauphoetae TaxID=2049346 RepID=A0ABQ9X6D3_9EUKA|nr:hypothetical protein BLNAU_17748 [Blattamonas nauphoetae]
MIITMTFCTFFDDGVNSDWFPAAGSVSVETIHQPGCKSKYSKRTAILHHSNLRETGGRNAEEESELKRGPDTARITMSNTPQRTITSKNPSIAD